MTQVKRFWQIMNVPRKKINRLQECKIPMSSFFPAKVLDHVHNPRNVGSLEDANVVVQAGDTICLVGMNSQRSGRDS